jgi:hypothetical protein
MSNLKIYGVLVHYESPEHVIPPRPPITTDPHGRAGNPKGVWSRSWIVAATTPKRAEARARKQLEDVDPKATVTDVRVTLVPGASHEPSPDVTVTIGDKSFTYKQPGNPDALLGD